MRGSVIKGKPGQPEIDATFFSRSSKSLRSTFDLSSSRTRFMRPVFLLISSRFNRISLVFSPTFSCNELTCPCKDLTCMPTKLNVSVFLPTCSNVASNFALMLGMSSRIGLISALMASRSAPISVERNLSSFLILFFMENIIMEKKLSVKQIISREGTGNGIMTASFDATNFHNYYNWAGNASNQSYDVYVRVLMPEDFGTWDATAAVTYYTNIDATPGNSGVTLAVYDTADALDDTDTKRTANGWNAYSVPGTDLNLTYTDGDYMTLKFTMTADSSKNAKLGEVKLKYNRE